MHASGEGDILALKDHLSREQDDVYFGFVREVENGKSYYALIAIVSETVSGVRRGELSGVFLWSGRIPDECWWMKKRGHWSIHELLAHYLKYVWTLTNPERFVHL